MHRYGGDAAAGDEPQIRSALEYSSVNGALLSIPRGDQPPRNSGHATGRAPRPAIAKRCARGQCRRTPENVKPGNRQGCSAGSGQPGCCRTTARGGRPPQPRGALRLRAADAKAIEVGTIAPPEMLRGVKVLVVDDNRTNRRILEGMLKRWEMKSRSVEGGEEALAQLSAAREAGEPYALILTDMHMPKMDGFALVERIRQRPELSTATIMMLTSAGHRGDAARCEELGVSAYLLKPIRQSELREAVARVLGARAHKGAIPLITRYSLQDARDPAAVLRLLLVEDNQVNKLLAVRLLEKRGHHVVVAGNGREALAALEKENFDLVLMDVQMPEMDGFEATAAIRNREKGTANRQPVVAMTAHAMKGDRERCLAAGMDGYLSKPIRPQELDNVLDQYVAIRQAPANSNGVPEPSKTV